MVTLFRYSNTNTYLVKGSSGALLFDTGWAGTFPALCKTLGENKLRLQDIDFLLISHFHPDHMGIAQDIADAGVTIAAADVQRDFIHISDSVFEKEKNSAFTPIDDSKVKIVPVAESRDFLRTLGIDGELIHTPGHTDDSISLWLDKEKTLLVGDLAPLYEREMHKGTLTEQSWQRLMKLGPKTVCYGHAKTAKLGRTLFGCPKPPPAQPDIYALVRQVTKLSDKGFNAADICEKTGADEVFVRDVIRMYVTHPGVSVQGILDRIEIKGK